MKVTPTTQIAKTSRKNRYFGMTRLQVGLLVVLTLVDSVLVIALIRLLELDFKTLTLYYGFAFLLLTFIGSFRITRFSGSIKRGIPVWREGLPKNMEKSLRKILSDIDNDNGFIRVDGNLRLIHARHSLYHTAWPYVACIDLSAQPPTIEYRAGLAGIMYLIPFFVGFSLFIVVMMGLNHLVERGAIRNFILSNLSNDDLSY